MNNSQKGGNKTLNFPISSPRKKKKYDLKEGGTVDENTLLLHLGKEGTREERSQAGRLFVNRWRDQWNVGETREKKGEGQVARASPVFANSWRKGKKQKQKRRKGKRGKGKQGRGKRKKKSDLHLPLCRSTGEKKGKKSKQFH